MKLTAQSSDLEAIIAAAFQVAKSPDPIRIIAERIGEPIDEVEHDTEDRPVEVGQIRIIAYNDAIVSEWRRPAEIHRAGSIAVTPEGLNTLVRTSKASEASFTLEDIQTENDRSLRMSTSRSAHEFPSVSEQVFETVVPGHTSGKRANLSNLARAIDTAKIAAANRGDAVGAKVALTGVNIKLRDNVFGIIGTDGKRLAAVNLREEDLGAVALGPSAYAGICIPFEGISLVTAMLSAGPAHIEIVSGSLVIENGDGSLSIRLVDAPYPDCSPLLNMRPPEKIRLAKSDLEIALQRSSVSLAKDKRSVAVKLSRDASGVHITSAAAGQSSSECVSETGGDEFSIGFDARYMLQAISIYGKGDIILAFEDGGQPINVTSGTNPEVRMLVMPCKIS
jgi:DNA polymerase-3 subunit beta